MAKVLEVRLAEPITIGPKDIPTGILKVPVSGPVQVKKNGLVGDFHADRRAHGSSEKVLCAYPSENYSKLLNVLPHLSKNVPTIGENLSTSGVLETNTHIGDIHKIGSTVIQVSQPRTPCYKLGYRLESDEAGKMIIFEGISGWYYRVIEEGEIQEGNEIELVERLQGSISVTELWELHRNKHQERGMTIPGLSEEWH